ncbi:hypothetical protein K8R47_02030 [archaeon]|nr:hypothetical protein [archaeon]
MKKLLSIVLITMLALVSFVSAYDNDRQDYKEPYSIEEVEVNGLEITDGQTLLDVNRGDTVFVRIQLEANSDVDDVKVKAWFGGYEYDDIEDVTNAFDITEGRTYLKVLRLELPNDMDADDYTLHIKAYDQDNSVETRYRLKLDITKPRHDLNIQDVIFTPGLTINADQPLFVTVRVENLGAHREEDIKVEVSIPELGISQRTYIDELASEAERDEDDEETSDSSDTIFVDLRNAPKGTYDLYVRVVYDRGHEVVEELYTLVIDGMTYPGVSGNVIAEADGNSKTTAPGQGVVYKISLANLGNTARTFSANVVGADAWATVRADPNFVTVQAGQTNDLFVYVSPNENVALGTQTFTVKIMEGSDLVEEINLQTEITGKSTGKYSNVLTGLEIGFIVLLIILVILGIIIAITRVSKKPESESGFEEPGSESQTYY